MTLFGRQHSQRVRRDLREDRGSFQHLPNVMGTAGEHVNVCRKWVMEDDALLLVEGVFCKLALWM